MSDNLKMPKKWTWGIGLFLVATAVSAGTYWNVLSSPSQVLAFNDGNIELVLSPIHRFPEAMLRVWDNETFFGLGCKQVSLTGMSLIETIGTVFARRWGQAVVLGLCSLAFFWWLRQYKMNRLVAALTAAIMIGTGACHNFTMVGLTVRAETMAFAALALGFLERGRCTGRWLPYAIAGGFLGLGITEVPDVGLLYALTITVVFWWTHFFFSPKIEGKTEVNTNHAPVIVTDFKNKLSSLPVIIGKFSLFVVCSGLLALQTISTIFSTQIQGVTQGAIESREERYAWATQWSVPPEEMWNMISGSYFGRSTRSAESPYWGRMGRDANWEQTRQGFRNFCMCGWHLGVVPGIFLLALIVLALHRGGKGEKIEMRAKTWLWLVIFVCLTTMLLMWGRYFPLYRLFWALPYFGTFRNPDKWSGPFTLFAGMGIAFLLEAMWRSLAVRRQESLLATQIWVVVFRVAIGLAVLGLLVGLSTLASGESFVSTRLAEGYAEQAKLMLDNAVLASFKVAMLAFLVGAGSWWVLRGLREGIFIRPQLVLSLIGVLAMSDQFFNNRGYAEGHQYQHYLLANPLTEYLDAHRTEGRIKLMPPHHPLLNNFRMTLLAIHGYDIFDPVSISRMPTDYARLFQALEQNYPIRLWEMGAMRYCLTLPGGLEQLNQMDGNHGRFVERLALGVGVFNDGYLPISESNPQQQVLRLIEFTGALPKYRLAGSMRAMPPTSEGDCQALARLGAVDFQPTKETLIHANLTAADLATSNCGTILVLEEAPAEVKLRVDIPTPAWLIRSAKFDPDWKVTVDGQVAEMFRADFLFQAVRVPAGKHEMNFRYRPSLQATWLALVTRIVLIILLGWYLITNQRGIGSIDVIDL